MILVFLKLFWSFAQVGLFSFGGGMAAMPLIQSQVVDLHQWLTLTEFTDLVTIAEMTPGPIAVNAATFVGIRVAGLPGALIATFGCVLPSFLIVTLLAKVYFKFRSQPVFSGVLSGLRPAVVALIACAGVNMLLLALWGEGGLSSGLRIPDWISAVLVLGCFFVLRKWKPSPITVMLGSGVLGGAAFLIQQALN